MLLQKEDYNGPYVMGETISFADITIVSSLTSFQKIAGESREEWQELS